MRASRVLQKCLSRSLGAMHTLRNHVLVRSVEALLRGRRLTLMDVARSWPDAERVKAPLKAFDRLLSNRHLHEERFQIYADMAQWLLRGKRPLIVIDWSDLKADRSWCLLRAAVPVGGRTLPILDMVFPGKELGAPNAHKRFLHVLRSLVPPRVRPILVTDAGFCTPWFRTVSSLGWHWVGRLRHRTLVKPVGIVDEDSQWVACRDLYALATTTPRDMGLMETVRATRWVCRLVVYGKTPRGRKDRNRAGLVSRQKNSRQAAAREREPWLIVASPELDLHARQLVNIYAKRMQIELSFRDLKSHRYGQGFEDSLTRSSARIEILLHVHAMASFASWLAGLACDASGITHWLSPIRSTRRLYSIIRVGREAIVRDWPIDPAWLCLARLRSLVYDALQPTQVAA